MTRAKDWSKVKGFGGGEETVVGCEMRRVTSGQTSMSGKVRPPDLVESVQLFFSV